MTIGDSYFHSTTNSPTILTSNSSPNTSFNNNTNINTNTNSNSNSNNNNIMPNSNTQFNSSPIPPIYQKNYQSSYSSNSPLSKSRCKRRSSESEDSLKKVRYSSPIQDSLNSNSNNNSNNIPINELNLQNINLEEYPKFNHPEGGIIQFTPIGNIRTFIGDNNIVQRIIEKNSTFDLNKTDRGIDGYKLYLGSVSMDSSPSNEIETYMRNGYAGHNHTGHDHASHNHSTHDHSYNSNKISNHYDNPAGCSAGCCSSNFDYDCDSDLEDDDDYMS
ncbi:Set1/Ash2 histone methyltransferase complex subunit ASH2 [Pichia californica]|uniref:Set1/Ash2 histone methyltransferase complex subunit ASH2 n=1 Tax=Pichia californica TaxID=460514 RepID=A0A9P6WQ83_9ASCO|nr:Set1/Ash2 histone methyltransferase complex subunit ASH2 [[Candida] californica]KAG0691090.1 Set1/Ash2 histone methyltransferase complex subunit ASH2 [[Candida] californica]